MREYKFSILEAKGTYFINWDKLFARSFNEFVNYIVYIIKEVNFPTVK